MTRGSSTGGGGVERWRVVVLVGVVSSDVSPHTCMTLTQNKRVNHAKKKVTHDPQQRPHGPKRISRASTGAGGGITSER